MKFSESAENNLRFLQLETEFVQVVVLPDFGGKIVSLRDLSRNREWLCQGPLPDAAIRYEVGDKWTGKEGWGWDECFPNISAAPPDLADHGEIWSRPWQFQMTEDGLVGTVEGYHNGYTFERRLRLERNTLVASYRVVNRTGTTIKGVWAMHSVFAAEPGMQIELPDSITRLTVGSANPVRTEEILSWPLTAGTNGDNLDLAHTPPREVTPYSLKLYTHRLQPDEGWAIFHGTESTLKLEFDPATVPFLGLWLNYGAWEGHYEVALEPTSSNGDALSTAIEQQTALSVEPRSSFGWEIRLELL